MTLNTLFTWCWSVITNMDRLSQPSPRSATKQFPFRFEVPFWRIIYKLICNITNARLAQWLCLLFLIMSFRRWGFKSWFRHFFLINILLLSRESSWPPDGHYLMIQFGNLEDTKRPRIWNLYGQFLPTMSWWGEEGRRNLVVGPCLIISIKNRYGTRWALCIDNQSN